MKKTMVSVLVIAAVAVAAIAIMNRASKRSATAAKILYGT